MIKTRDNKSWRVPLKDIEMKLYRKGEQLHVNRVRRWLMIEPQVPYIYIASKDYDVFKKQIT